MDFDLTLDFDVVDLVHYICLPYIALFSASVTYY